MLNLDTKQTIYIIPMPIFQDYYVLISRIDKSCREQVIITYITEEEEQQLDKGKQLTLERGNASFQVHGNNIYCYGNGDFNESSDDCKQIATFNFLDYLDLKGVMLPSD